MTPKRGTSQKFRSFFHSPETIFFPAALGPQGLHTTTRELQTREILGPPPFGATTKIQQNDPHPSEESPKNVAGKCPKREIGGPHPSGPHPSGPHPSGPHPSGPHPSGQSLGGPTFAQTGNSQKTVWAKWAKCGSLLVPLERSKIGPKVVGPKVAKSAGQKWSGPKVVSADPTVCSQFSHTQFFHW